MVQLSKPNLFILMSFDYIWTSPIALGWQNILLSAYRYTQYFDLGP
jgi:hypothetical protein